MSSSVKWDIGIGFAFLVFALLLIYVYLKYCARKNRRANGKKYRRLEEKEEEEEDYVPPLPNLAFYRNQLRSKPYGEFIKTMLSKWKGDYDTLERNHSYIQWLFPNRISGTNRHAHTLNDEEAEMIKKTPELRERVKKAFEMMLDYYGMRLTRNNQFELAENCEERLKELNKWGSHDFQRISRILLALKELGHKDLMQPWMKFMAELIYKEKVLNQAESSFKDYWLDTLDAVDKIQLNIYLGDMKYSKE